MLGYEEAAFFPSTLLHDPWKCKPPMFYRLRYAASYRKDTLRSSNIKPGADEIAVGHEKTYGLSSHGYSWDSGDVGDQDGMGH